MYPDLWRGAVQNNAGLARNQTCQDVDRLGRRLQALGDEDVRVRLAAVSGLAGLAMADRLPVDLLPRMEWLVTHDDGAVEGYPVVREVAARVVRNLRRMTG